MIKKEDVSTLSIKEAQERRQYYENRGLNVGFKVLDNKVYIVEYKQLKSL